MNIAWLQTPFLLNITLAASNYISAFPFVPKPTIELFQRLDLAWSCLLRGKDDEGDLLPGSESARQVTLTEKVRLRSIVERIRLQVVLVAEQDDCHDEEKGQYTITNTKNEDDDRTMSVAGCATGDDTWGMEIAKVFERTIVDLSTSLDGNLSEPL